MSEDEKWMARCLQLASCGRYGAPPNPMVGAVITYEGKAIGEGYHRHCGQGHAEVNALASVRRTDLLAKSKMYVSLEPCSHYGRTPPCAQLIIDKGIPEVVVGCIDPFARVHGHGIQMLRDAGVKVTVGVMERECRLLNRRFIIEQKLDRPYVLLKWAESCDGYLDLLREGGRPTHLSTPQSQLRVHRLRAECQAILVGRRTAMLDNPQLTVCLVDGPQPLRIVLDRRGILPGTLRLFDTSAPTLVCGATDNPHRPHREGCEYLEMDYSHGSILPQLLSYLKSRGIQSLLVEGGRNLLQSFITEGIWDEIHREISSRALGNGLPAPLAPVGDRGEIETVLGTTFCHYYNRESERLVLEDQ